MSSPGLNFYTTGKCEVVTSPTHIRNFRHVEAEPGGARLRDAGGPFRRVEQVDVKAITSPLNRDAFHNTITHGRNSPTQSYSHTHSSQSPQYVHQNAHINQKTPRGNESLKQTRFAPHSNAKLHASRSAAALHEVSEPFCTTYSSVFGPNKGEGRQQADPPLESMRRSFSSCGLWGTKPANSTFNFSREGRNSGGEISRSKSVETASRRSSKLSLRDDASLSSSLRSPGHNNLYSPSSSTHKSPSSPHSHSESIRSHHSRSSSSLYYNPPSSSISSPTPIPSEAGWPLVSKTAYGEEVRKSGGRRGVKADPTGNSADTPDWFKVPRPDPSAPFPIHKEAEGVMTIVSRMKGWMTVTPRGHRVGQKPGGVDKSVKGTHATNESDLAPGWMQPKYISPIVMGKEKPAQKTVKLNSLRAEKSRMILVDSEPSGAPSPWASGYYRYNVRTKEEAAQGYENAIRNE